MRERQSAAAAAAGYFRQTLYAALNVLSLGLSRLYGMEAGLS